MTAPRILVVDDNVVTIELTSFILGAGGFVVASTSDANRAVHEISTFRPDLILMDIQMPGLDGLELTRQIKRTPSSKDILIVAFTAFAMKGDEAKMLEAGCDGYIAKPFDVAMFADTIRLLLYDSPTRAFQGKRLD
jgi:two-component system cell cycle response regulator DivK